MSKQGVSSEGVLLKTKQYKKKSQWAQAWRRLCRNKGAIAGLVIFILLLTMALSAPYVFDYDEVVIGTNMSRRLQGPTGDHPFGTDELGRDILARVAYGARTSLSIGVIVCALALIMGSALGAVSGFFGGKTDNILMRVMDIFLALPGPLLAICIVAALGASTRNLIIALTVSSVPGFARVMRGPVLTVRDVEYVEAAKAIGARKRTIILSHVLPNCMAPVFVHTALSMAGVILSVAGLSFLGLGISPPAPEWGSMLASSRDFIRDHSYMALFPGLAIMLTILSLNLLGDGLRDALDPRLK